MYSKATGVSNADYAKVVPPPNGGYPMIVPIQHEISLETGSAIHFFIFQNLKFVFNSEEKDSLQPINFPDSWTSRDYMNWRGYSSPNAISIAKEKYGDNKLHLSIPSFIELFLERATAPFFVFQVFSVALWCLDEYWLYPLMTLGLLIIFESGLVVQQMRNLKQIREMGAKPYRLPVYRSNRWAYVLSEDLVAGDVISVNAHSSDRLIPCDLLLLRGSCIVDESMLTGESIPVTKEPCEARDMTDNHHLNPDTEKEFILFGGTSVVQLTPPLKSNSLLKAPDNGCVCFVVRTGFSTSQGRLLKTIMYSVKSVTANNLETLLFIAFLLVFAISASAYVWIEGTSDPQRNRYKLFLECTLIIVSVIPQELPIELSLAVNTSLAALSKKLIFCTEPFRIPFAGRVDICCFDKTGTLTEDEVIVEGVTGLNDQLANQIVAVKHSPLATIHVLATAHSLARTSTGLLGDPLEKAMLQSVGWSLSSDGVLTGRTSPRSPHLRVYKRFRFTSELKRMSVIAGFQSHTSVDIEYMACVKGSPEVLKVMFSDAPLDYDEAYLTMARRGARVLALGQKPLGKLSHQRVREMRREEVESGLHFAGFVIISCPLKPDSITVIRTLRLSSHHLTMVTGDNPLTACHVGGLLGFLRPDRSVLLFTPPTPSCEVWHWKSVDDTFTIPAEPLSRRDLPKLVKEFELCLTGTGIQYLRSSHDQPACSRFLLSLLPKVRVLSRVAPDQKEFILAALRSLGFTTLMCGDGTNDMGALKQAHVGVALLNRQPEPLLKLTDVANDEAPLVQLGDASIAAPFTAKMISTVCVCDIIRQGRCTLVTTLQMFKILAVNALISAYSMSVLFLKGFKISDGQATAQAFLMTGCFLFISRSKPLNTISKERPLPNVFNVYTLLTVAGQFTIHFSALYMMVQAAEERMPLLKDGEFVDIYQKFMPSILNTVVYLIVTAMQISTIAVNYEGHPFRESLIENRPLFVSLVVALVGVIGLVFGVCSESLEILVLDNDMRIIFFKAVLFDYLSAWIIDRFLFMILGRKSMRSL